MKAYCYECQAINGMFSKGVAYDIVEYGGPLGLTIEVKDALGRTRSMSIKNPKFIVKNDCDRRTKILHPDFAFFEIIA